MKKYNLPGIWIAVILLYVISGLLSPATIKINHVFDILQITSFLGIAAIGQTIVILTGGIDLSIGGIITATNIVVCSLMNGKSENIILGLLICLILGFVLGSINGLLITKLKITPLIATLAMNTILFGASLIYTSGIPKGSIPHEFAIIGQGHLWGIPISFIIWVLLVLIAKILTNYTVLGRSIYAVGANIRAAYAAGINTQATLIKTYILSAESAVCTGLLLSAYINLPSFGIGEPYTLNSIAAAVVGGTLLTGGVGSVVNSAGGAIFITQLISLTNMLKMSTGTQFLIQGVIIAIGFIASKRIRLKERSETAKSEVNIVNNVYNK